MRPFQKNAFWFLLVLAFSGALVTGCEDGNGKADFTSISDSTFVSLGTAVTDEAFNSLSGHLGRSMQEGGVPFALTYCKEKAIPLTDSLSEHFGDQIRRASTKNRNPSNAATAAEQEILTLFDGRKDSPGMEKFAPEVRRAEAGPVSFYRPIFALGKCMACHGRPGIELDSVNLAGIRELYPEDKAIGFQPGDLRGMWVVEFSDAARIDSLQKMLAPDPAPEK